MAAKQEIEKTKDPTTGTVPRERLINAIPKKKYEEADKSLVYIIGFSNKNILFTRPANNE